MIKDIDINIIVHGDNKRHFEKMTEKVLNKGDTMTINQLQISKYSKIEVECSCDNCGETHFKLRRNITTNNSYCSEDCRKISLSKKMNKESQTKERLKQLLINRINNGESIIYNTLKKEYPSLLYGIERSFGSISKICEEIGISKEQLVNDYGFTNNIDKRTLSQDEMFERLLYLKKIGRLTTSAMRTEFDDLRLEISLKKVYGSVEKSLNFFNLERDFVSSSEFINGGLKFENLFKRVLDSLNINHIYKKQFNDIFPDFRLEEKNIWIDSKLSSWTSSIEQTIEKYTPHCEKLIIVYLRGKDRTDINNDKVVFRKIDYYFSDLVNIGRNDLIEEIQNLKSHF